MIIKRVEIRNFRSIRDATLDCENLTVLVGRNGAGKSSFLHALDVFYDIDAPVTEEDFFNHPNHDKEVGIELRVTYAHLRPDEEMEFDTYARNGELIVSKRITLETGGIKQRYYAASMQVPEFAEVRKEPGRRDRVGMFNDLVASGRFPGLTDKVKSADEAEYAMTEYQRANPQLTQPVERQEQFFGPRNIGGGKLDKFTKYVLVPAVKEASDEATGKKGSVYQLLQMIVLRRINARQDIQEFQAEFDGRVKALYSSENLTELPELGASISETLKRFSPGAELSLTWGEVVPPRVQLPDPRTTLVEDGFPGEVSRKGHGLQRALILTLLQHLALAPAPRAPASDSAAPGADAPETEVVAASAGPDLILGVEEPELYLHPLRCRYLARLLLELADNPDAGLGARNQVIYTTHSPYFVDLHRFDQVRVISKGPGDDSQAASTAVNQFSLEEASAELARVWRADPSVFGRETFKCRAMPIMNAIVNEGFFADVVVVVEGDAEVGALWKLQEIRQKHWTQVGIAVVPAGGKNNVDRPTVIFRGLSIPTYFVFDADAHLRGHEKKGKKAVDSNRGYLRLAGAQEEDFPETNASENYAVFAGNLEAAIQEAAGQQPFEQARQAVAEELGYEKPSRVTKNIEGSARLVERIYNEGLCVPILDDIVDKVTKLHPGPGTR